MDLYLLRNCVAKISSRHEKVACEQLRAMVVYKTVAFYHEKFIELFERFMRDLTKNLLSYLKDLCVI